MSDWELQADLRLAQLSLWMDPDSHFHGMVPGMPPMLRDWGCGYWRIDVGLEVIREDSEGPNLLTP